MRRLRSIKIEYTPTSSYSFEDIGWLQSALEGKKDKLFSFAARRRELMRFGEVRLPSYLLVPLAKSTTVTTLNRVFEEGGIESALAYFSSAEEKGVLLTDLRELQKDSFDAISRVVLQIGIIFLAFFVCVTALVVYQFWYHERYGFWNWNYNDHTLEDFFGF